MNIFRNKTIFKLFVNMALSYNDLSQQICSLHVKTAWKNELSYRCFSLDGSYSRTTRHSGQLIFHTNAVVLIVIIC